MIADAAIIAACLALVAINGVAAGQVRAARWQRAACAIDPGGTPHGAAERWGLRCGTLACAVTAVACVARGGWDGYALGALLLLLATRLAELDGGYARFYRSMQQWRMRR